MKMKLRKQIKLNAKRCLCNNWGKAVSIVLLTSAIYLLFVIIEMIANLLLQLPASSASAQELSSAWMLSYLLTVLMAIGSFILLVPLHLGITAWYHSLSEGVSDDILSIFGFFANRKMFFRSLWLSINTGVRAILYAVLYLILPTAGILFSVRLLNSPLSSGAFVGSMTLVFSIALFVLLCAAYILTVRYEVKMEKRRELAIMLSFFIAGMSEPFMANLSFKNLTLLFIGEYYYQAAPFWQRGIVGRIAGKKIRMTPWTEKEMNIALPEWSGLHDLPAYLKGNCLKMLATGIAAVLLSGGIYYYTVKPADCVYADTGLSDYWSGEKVYLNAAELPDDWNSIIVGNADGNTEMYVLTGNIVWLEQVRESVSIGLGVGMFAMIASGFIAVWLGKKRSRGKRTL